jgi:hypothetical protein
MMGDSERLTGSSGPLEELFAGLKDSRLEALNEVRELQIIGRVLFQNEAGRMDNRFGGDHPRTRSLRSTLEQNLNNITDLGVETELAEITIPKVEEGQTLIHGRVIDERFRGVQGLFVSLADEEGRLLTPLGRAETDASGYYALVVDPDALERVSEAAREGVFLNVRTRKDEIVHSEFEPLRIAKGDREIVEVVLRREDLIGGISRPEYRREAGHEAAGGYEPSGELALERLWGIGLKRADRLRHAGIADIRALLEADDAKLREILGNMDVQKLKQESAAILEQVRD